MIIENLNSVRRKIRVVTGEETEEEINFKPGIKSGRTKIEAYAIVMKEEVTNLILKRKRRKEEGTSKKRDLFSTSMNMKLRL